MGDLGLSTAPLKRQPNPDTPPGPLWHKTLLRKIRVLWEQSGHCLCWGGCTRGIDDIFEDSAPSADLLQENWLLLHPPSLGQDVAVTVLLFSRTFCVGCTLATGAFSWRNVPQPHTPVRCCQPSWPGSLLL